MCQLKTYKLITGFRYWLYVHFIRTTPRTHIQAREIKVKVPVQGHSSSFLEHVSETRQRIFFSNFGQMLNRSIFMLRVPSTLVYGQSHHWRKGPSTGISCPFHMPKPPEEFSWNLDYILTSLWQYAEALGKVWPWNLGIDILTQIVILAGKGHFIAWQYSIHWFTTISVGHCKNKTCWTESFTDTNSSHMLKFRTNSSHVW